MPNRYGSDASPSDQYSFGYQGSEKDGEVHGESYTTHFRQYDTRIGRWLSRDPLAYKQPSASPYFAMNNNPILYNDEDGDIAVVAVVGFFKGLFSKPTNGNTRLQSALNTAKKDALNSLQVYSSLIRVDKNKSGAGKVGQVVSRLIWQVPQQVLGIIVGNVSVILGVDEIVHTEQGTTLIKRTTGKKMREYLRKNRYGYFYSAFTLGSIVNYSGDANTKEGEEEIDEVMRKHEFGHYQQSKRWGPLYLITIALPSIVSATQSPEFHESTPWERGANKLSDRYFEKNKPKEKSSGGGSGMGGIHKEEQRLEQIESGLKE